MPKTETELRDGRKHDFFIVDNEVVEDHGQEIGAYGIAVYCYLAMKAAPGSVAFPAIKTVGSALKLSEATVKRTLHALRDAGLIEIEVRKEERPGRKAFHRPNTYTLLPVRKHREGVGSVGTQVGSQGTQVGSEGAQVGSVGPLINIPLTRSSDQDSAAEVVAAFKAIGVRDSQIKAALRLRAYTLADAAAAAAFKKRPTEGTKSAIAVICDRLKLGEDMPEAAPEPASNGHAPLPPDATPEVLVQYYEELDANYRRRM